LEKINKKIKVVSVSSAVILATQEAEIRRISVQRQPGQKVQENPISKKTITKKG
jgi:hypothetical protein